jgi:hypothetical protein
MTDNADIFQRIRSNYTDMSEEDARFLAQRTVSWLAILSNTTTEFIERAKKANKDAHEERAIVLAASVISTVVANKLIAERDQLTDLTDYLLTITHEADTSV